MTSTAVVLADSARARLFEVADHRGQGGARENELVELQDLVQPGRRQPVGQGLTESRPGIRRGDAPGGPGHGVDDHRDAQVEEGDRRFAAEVVAAAAAICSARSIGRLLVAAPPRFVGHLRDLDIESACDAVEVITRDFSMLTPPRALERLQKSGHLRAP